MKKAISLLCACILLISLLCACGGTTETAETEPKIPEEIQTYLDKADNSRASNNYEQAINYYLKAGDLGLDGLKATVLDMAAFYSHPENLNPDMLAYGTPFADAAAILTEYMPDLIAPEEGAPHLEALLRQWAQQEDPAARNYHQMAEYMDILQSYGYHSAELEDEIYYNVGLETQDFSQKLEILSKASEGTRCYSLAEGIRLIQAGNPVEGATLLAESLEMEGVAQMLYSDAVKDYRDQKTNTLNELLEKEHSLDMAWEIISAITEDPEDIERKNRQEESADLDKFFNDHVITVGIDKIDENIEFTEADRQEMENLCGTAPNGKLLILHKRPVFYGSDVQITEVDLYHMEMLPDEFYPNSLEEVQYVVLFESSYRDTGNTYSKGTKEIKETTKLTLYDAVTGKQLYTASATSTPKSSFTYSGEPPKYYSGFSPEMDSAMKQVLQTIRNAMNK